jgi:hypothetical protein
LKYFFMCKHTCVSEQRKEGKEREERKRTNAHV